MEKDIKSDNRIVIGNNAYSAVVAFLGCIGSVGIIANENSISYSNSFFSVLLFGIAFYLLKRISPEFRNSELRHKIYAYVFSILLSTALHMGAQLELYDNVDFKKISMYLGIVCLAIFLAPIINGLWNAFFSLKKTDDLKKNDEKKLKLTSVWLIIFLLWIPTFLAFFPGAFVYDATDEYIEVVSRQFTMHHPLLHVLLLGGLVHLGEYIGAGANSGIAIYTLFQMAVFSWIFAYVIMFLQSRQVRKKYLMAIIIFVGLFPVIPMYAVCSAKDTLFSGAFLLVLVGLLQFMEDERVFFNKSMFIFVASSVVMMLLRNNGAYAYIAAIPFTVLCICEGIDKKRWYKLLVLMILSVMLYKGSEYCLKTVCHATDSEHQEKFTVAIQQIARVYKYAPEVFSEEDKAALYEVLPENYLITYTPRCSDVLKSGFDNSTYSLDAGKYQKLWLKIGLKKPLIYINAWLVNSYGYWYPDMIINVYGGNQMYTYQYKDSSYFGFETEPPGERHSLFPLLERLYRNISLELFQQKVPVISMLFAPAFLFWIFALFFIGTMREKMWKSVASYMPILLLWGTVLLGPTVLVRYMLILWCAMPVIIFNRNN